MGTESCGEKIVPDGYVTLVVVFPRDFNGVYEGHGLIIVGKAD